jgi:hypothetical protein
MCCFWEIHPQQSHRLLAFFFCVDLLFCHFVAIELLKLRAPPALWLVMHPLVLKVLPTAATCLLIHIIACISLCDLKITCYSF